MSTIALPAGFCPRDFSMMLQTVQRVSSSPFGGSEQVVDLLNDRWTVSLTLPARRSADAARVEAFVAALRGMTNTVELHHFGRPAARGTLSGGTPQSSGVAAQGANQIVIDATPGETLLAGDLIGIDGLLLMVAADAVSNGLGKMTIPLVNRLRRAIGAGILVTWIEPKATFRLASSAAVQYVPGYSPEVSLDFVEAIS